MNNQIKLRLILDVTYDPNGTDIETLKDMLADVADRAANDGLLTGSTSAEVDAWNCDVKVDLSNIRSAKLGTPEHAAFTEALEEVADSLWDGGATIRPDYSGRGMFGAMCHGIEADNGNKLLAAIAKAGLPIPRTDSMGLGMIAYWPTIEGKKRGEE